MNQQLEPHVGPGRGACYPRIHRGRSAHTAIRAPAPGLVVATCRAIPCSVKTPSMKPRGSLACGDAELEHRDDRVPSGRGPAAFKLPLSTKAQPAVSGSSQQPGSVGTRHARNRDCLSSRICCRPRQLPAVHTRASLNLKFPLGPLQWLSRATASTCQCRLRLPVAAGHQARRTTGSCRAGAAGWPQAAPSTAASPLTLGPGASSGAS